MAYKDKEKQKATVKAWRERNRERRAEYDKVWRERNREQRAATKKAWRERNREKVAKSNKAWDEKNPERRAAVQKAYRERNRQRTAAASKAWRERNHEWIVTYNNDEHNRKRRAAVQKAYRERNPERVAERGRRRRCRERNASIRLTANETQKILILERTRQELQKETGGEYHIDHILPIVHGGIHHPMNLRILEGRENESKQDKLLPEAIDLAYEHFMLYHDRVSPERAWEFVHQLAEGLGISVDEIRIDDQQITLSLPTKSTLEDLME
jgi:hypothetical protein